MKLAMSTLFGAWAGAVSGLCGIHYGEPRMWLLAVGSVGFWMYLDRDRK